MISSQKECLQTKISRAERTLEIINKDIADWEAEHPKEQRGHLDNQKFVEICIPRKRLELAIAMFKAAELSNIHEHKQVQEPLENLNSGFEDNSFVI